MAFTAALRPQKFLARILTNRARRNALSGERLVVLARLLFATFAVPGTRPGLNETPYRISRNHRCDATVTKISLDGLLGPHAFVERTRT